MKRSNTMITSKKLSSERIKEIKDYPITYNEDSPKLSADQIACMKKGNQTRINKTLREVMIQST